MGEGFFAEGDDPKMLVNEGLLIILRRQILMEAKKRL
jgi:hypothetical protein